MGFLAPAAIGLAALIPIIIAMYLLKLRRTEQVVSSVYLWRRMVRDVEANAPWQRLRRNLLLLLQILFLAALILALARPFRWVPGARARAAILILDTSASMAATDLTPNRLEAAKARIAQMVDDMPDDARVTLITAGQEAQVLVSSSQDRRQIKLAIDEIQVSNAGSDLTAALELASAVTARQPDTDIVVLSDGRVTLPERLSLSGHVRYLPMGLSGDNQAISSLSLEQARGITGTTAFAQITNYSQATAQRRLTFYADGQLVDAYDLEIASGDQRAVVAEGLPAGTQVLEAQLTGQDSLPLDDRAWAVRPDVQPAAVTLISDGNLFLETGLALLPNVEVTSLRPQDFEQGEEVGSVEDLTILDAYVPLTTTLPAGNLLFIAPPRGTSYFTVTGTLDVPMLRAVDPEDPLLAYVDVSEANVLQAARMPLPAWARPIIVGDSSGDTAPLLFAGEVDGRRVAVLAFDLHSSDLPLQVAFPVLLANLTGWLAPGGGGELPGQVSPGAPVSLSLPPEVESATLTRPDGSTIQLAPKGGGAVFADTGQLGVYRLAWQLPQGTNDEPVERRFAVNLFSPQESDVRPADELALVGGETASQSQAAQQTRREWWRPLALMALILLVAEWLVYQRAALFRLWGQARRVVASHE
jgi:Ca-activated chloride channel family protein